MQALPLNEFKCLDGPSFGEKPMSPELLKPDTTERSTDSLIRTSPRLDQDDARNVRSMILESCGFMLLLGFSSRKIVGNAKRLFVSRVLPFACSPCTA